MAGSERETRTKKNNVAWGGTGEAVEEGRQHAKGKKKTKKRREWDSTPPPPSPPPHVRCPSRTGVAHRPLPPPHEEEERGAKGDCAACFVSGTPYGKTKSTRCTTRADKAGGFVEVRMRTCGVAGATPGTTGLVERARLEGSHPPPSHEKKKKKKKNEDSAPLPILAPSRTRWVAFGKKRGGEGGGKKKETEAEAPTPAPCPTHTVWSTPFLSPSPSAVVHETYTAPEGGHERAARSKARERRRTKTKKGEGKRERTPAVGHTGVAGGATLECCAIGSPKEGTPPLSWWNALYASPFHPAAHTTRRTSAPQPQEAEAVPKMHHHHRRLLRLRWTTMKTPLPWASLNSGHEKGTLLSIVVPWLEKKAEETREETTTKKTKRRRRKRSKT